MFLCTMLLSTACARYQPPPSVVERNYESDSIIKRVKIGRDFNLWPPLRETPEHARERLLTSIRQECPRHRLLGEGETTENRAEWDNVFNRTENEQDTYLWMRYRCEQ